MAPIIFEQINPVIGIDSRFGIVRPTPDLIVLNELREVVALFRCPHQHYFCRKVDT